MGEEPDREWNAIELRAEIPARVADRLDAPGAVAPHNDAVSGSEPWSVLRGLRANPPGRAAEDDRRRSVFAASLEQAEQFLSAAVDVGHATKPVQLFYALSQAGRAIADVLCQPPGEKRAPLHVPWVR
jgi:hypothetical protein